MGTNWQYNTCGNADGTERSLITTQPNDEGDIIIVGSTIKKYVKVYFNFFSKRLI